MLLCIVRKNNIAIDCAAYALASGLVDKEDLIALPASSDLREVGFQKSFVAFSRKEDFRGVERSELYRMKYLVLPSLQYDKLLSVNKFSTRRLFNLHFSLLPKYKGMYASVRPILIGENVSGVTLHEIDGGMDTGNIIDQRVAPIRADDTSRDLYLKYIRAGTMLVNKNLELLLAGTYESLRQTSYDST